jgi:hypothetical protein
LPIGRPGADCAVAVNEAVNDVVERSQAWLLFPKGGKSTAGSLKRRRPVGRS